MTASDFTYFAALAVCAVMMVPLEVAFAMRVVWQGRRLARAVLPVIGLFVVWDVVAIARDHWTFNPDNLTGWYLPFDLPLEEFAFFVVVPICAIYSYEAVRITLEGTSPLVRRIRDRRDQERADA